MALVVILALIWNFSNLQGSSSEISFSEFMNRVNRNEVAEVTFTGYEIAGKFQTTDASIKTFHTVAPNSYTDLAKSLVEKGLPVNVRKETAGAWTTILLSWAP